MKGKTMKYRVLCHILVFLLCVGGLLAQEQDSTQTIYRTARNGVYAEVLGNAGYYSVNYERFLSDPISLRVGFSAFTNNYEIQFPQSFILVPILINFLTSQSEHNFEVGAGLLVQFVSIPSFQPKTITSLSIRLGYRYQPLKGGFIFGIAFTPLVDPGYDGHSSSPFGLWGGISLGWAF